MSSGLTSNGNMEVESWKGNELKYSEIGRRTHEESLVMHILSTEKRTYPSLRTFRVAVKELGNIGHDRLFIRALHVNVLRVQKSCDSQFGVRNLTKNSKVKLMFLNELCH